MHRNQVGAEVPRGFKIRLLPWGDDVMDTRVFVRLLQAACQRGHSNSITVEMEARSILPWGRSAPRGAFDGKIPPGEDATRRNWKSGFNAWSRFIVADLVVALLHGLNTLFSKYLKYIISMQKVIGGMEC